MALTARKRFPIAFEMSSTPGVNALSDAARSRSAGEPSDAIVRVALRQGWSVTQDDFRWVVDAGEGRRVLAESSTGIGGERLLRFRSPLSWALQPIPPEAELLRKNARSAHSSVSIGSDGRATLVATLVEATMDDGEIDAVLRSMLSGGETIGTKPIADFDPTSYRTPADAGEWEAIILRESLGHAAIAFQFAGSRAVASLSLERGRHKSVHLLFDRTDAWGDQLVQAISICAPAPLEWHNKALLANANMLLGSFALATFGPLESLVVTRTQLARTIEPEGLLAMVTSLARIADRAEEELIGSKTAAPKPPPDAGEGIRSSPTE